jgi:hypothetical protein
MLLDMMYWKNVPANIITADTINKTVNNGEPVKYATRIKVIGMTTENRCIIKTICTPDLFSFIKHISFKWYFTHVFYIGY